MTLFLVNVLIGIIVIVLVDMLIEYIRKQS